MSRLRHFEGKQVSDLSTLHQLLDTAAAAHPNRLAIEDPGRGQLRYAQLQGATVELAGALAAQGVGVGDRVGLYLQKSLASIVSLFAILRNGAAYVPVDATAPVSRNCYIFRDCAVRALIVEQKYLEALLLEWGSTEGVVTRELALFHPHGLQLVLVTFPPGGLDHDTPPGLAYILYTSGSTGKPKGVMHTHSSALAFVEWCAVEFDISAQDRFSSHAPLHFDLSIFDVFVALRFGAALVLIGESAGKQPLVLADMIHQENISVWYSTPSILRLLVEFGRLGERDYSHLRLVLFAGETYPVKQFLQLRQYWRTPLYYNLYGPTETNVCTFYRLPGDLRESTFNYFPIGTACSGDELLVVDEGNEAVSTGDAGELLVRGSSVMCGYWNLAQRNRDAFLRIGGAAWYRTGDIVRQLPDGNLDYISRRDRMIKRRGYRVELGEIEAALYRSEKVVEAAAVAVSGADAEVRVKAFIACRAGAAPTIIEMKIFSAQQLPAYMIPDQFVILQELPKTSTDKIDYQKLKDM